MRKCFQDKSTRMPESGVEDDEDQVDDGWSDTSSTNSDDSKEVEAELGGWQGRLSKSWQSIDSGMATHAIHSEIGLTRSSFQAT